MPTSTLTSKGQVTIPKEVRDVLHLSPGDRVEFVVEPDGGVRVRAMTSSALALFRFLPRRGKGASSEELDRSIREGRMQDDERIRRDR